MSSEEKQQHDRRNFFSIAASIILLRFGWIFKTESVVMPAFIDALGGGPAMRGWLLVLNRLGQSVPQFLVAHRIAALRKLKPWFILMCAIHLIPWAAMALLFGDISETSSGFLGVFLVCYGAHWLLFGTARIFEGACQGRLIRPEVRGKLLSTAGSLGGLGAVCLAAWLMSDWMAAGRYDYIFWTIFGFFALSACSLLGLKEKPEDFEVSGPIRFRDTIEIFFKDHEFRKLLVSAMFLSFIFLLFPHFVILGKQRLGFEVKGFASLVIVQNLGMAIASVTIGPIADRWGNRLAFRIAAVGPFCAPIVALLLASQGESARAYFPCVYALLGMCPVMQRLLTNYALEMSPTTSQPQYLATIQLTVILPLMFSPLVGVAIGIWGFEPIFIVCIAAIGLGWLLTFRIREPRRELSVKPYPDTPQGES